MWQGLFLNYADILIRSRVIDYGRKELRHRGSTLYEENDGDNRSLLNTLADKNDVFEEMVTRRATQQEIKELSAVMRKFNVSFADAADNCPKQERTMEACVAAIKYATDNPLILDELLRIKKLQLAKLGYAVVLDENGKFIKTANMRYEVGQILMEIFWIQK